MGPTDGNLYALAQYQQQVDDTDAWQSGIDRLCEELDIDAEEAHEMLCRQIDDAAISRAEDMAEARLDMDAEGIW